MDLLAVFPAAPSPELARTLDLAGFRWKGIDGADDLTANEWSGVVVAIESDASVEAGWSLCRSVRARSAELPVLVLVGGAQLGELDTHGDLFEDFCLTPFHPAEVEARLRHLFVRATGSPAAGETVAYADLALNLETYQATIEGRPLDLTYMEYELLKFLAQSPGKVFTRETLLSRVWGYEYFGGARTVDVHIRRLRAKLGEEHANLIQTVRSVGYRFGQSRWS